MRQTPSGKPGAVHLPLLIVMAAMGLAAGGIGYAAASRGVAGPRQDAAALDPLPFSGPIDVAEIIGRTPAPAPPKAPALHPPAAVRYEGDGSYDPQAPDPPSASRAAATAQEREIARLKAELAEARSRTDAPRPLPEALRPEAPAAPAPLSEAERRAQEEEARARRRDEEAERLRLADVAARQERFDRARSASARVAFGGPARPGAQGLETGALTPPAAPSGLDLLAALAGAAAPAPAPAARPPALNAPLTLTRAPAEAQSAREAPASPFVLRAGGVIPAVLVSGLTSDLPGSAIAQVSVDVYDTATGRILLIPQGAKLMGSYESSPRFGQERVFVLWTRLVFPDASAVDLGAAAGADRAGHAGFSDETDNHLVRTFGGAALMSLLGAGAQLSQPAPVAGEARSPWSVGVGEVGRGFAETGRDLIRRDLDVAPTLTIRPGYRFHVMLQRDLVFDRPWEP